MQVRRKKTVNRADLAPRYPLSVELKYKAILFSIVNKVGAVAREEVNRHGPTILAAIEEEKSQRSDNILAQGWAALLRIMLNAIFDRTANTLNEGLDSVASLSASVNRASRTTWNKQIRAAYGVDILRGEPQLAGLLSAWEQENLDLIRSIPGSMVDRLRGKMMQAFTSGASMKDLALIVRETTGVGKSRSELIARDQIGRLNGQLAEARQTSAGIDEYIWRTSQDERVRPTHVVRNGKSYRWDAGGIKPGSEIRCRCNAEPIFPEVIGTDSGSDG